jgi:type I restriction enzyme S subunit
MKSEVVWDSVDHITHEAVAQSATSIIEPGAVLMVVRSGILARTVPVALAGRSLTLNQDLKALCPRPSIDSKFLYYLLLAKMPELLALVSRGATVHRLITDQIRDIEFRLPPLTDQRRIVAILDEACEGIATAKAHAEKNLRNAREVFDGMTQALFPEDEQIGNDAQSLEDLCELIVDCEHRTAPIEAEGIPSVRTPNIGKGKLLLEGVNRVSEATYGEWTRRAEPQGGDLVLAREAPAGNVAVIPEGMKLCLGQRTVLIRPRKSVLVPSYLAQLLLRRDSQKRLLAHSRGATVQHINLKDIRAFKIGRLPSLGTQAAVIERVEEIGDQDLRLKGIYEKRMAALDELKQSLLHKAFSGQL